MTSFPTIGIIAKPNDVRAAVTLNRLIDVLQRRQRDGTLQTLLACDEDSERPIAEDLPRVSRRTLAERCQLVIVIGGDGTLLSAARGVAAHGVPLLGINQGRLGFLVEIRPDQLEQALDAVLDGHYTIEERLLLSARVRHSDGSGADAQLAVNDVVVRNLASIRMLEFETWLDQEFISRHRADGLIVSTPTGSTAYALSGGGPILHPDLSALTLVPICPHTLTDRPIVVPSNRVIRVITRGNTSTGATVTCDGQIGAPLQADDTVEVTLSPHRLRLLHTAGYSYFNLLRDKLLWGRGAAFDIDRA